MLGLRRLFNGRPRGNKLSWEDLFRLFREIMDSNNRAIEAITDMGEKLGGDYLFDINYIKTAYPGLQKAVGTSILGFDTLTQGKYQRIKDAFDRIDSRINIAINDEPAGLEKTIVSYEDIGWDMAREAGGKNANLAEVKNQLGLKVPPAFAITTRAYDMFMGHNGLTGKAQELSQADDPEPGAIEELQGMIIAGEIPPALSADIDTAINSLSAAIGKPFFLAVRSSAEEEDSDFSFAGQFRTVLNVPAKRADVEEAYKRVLASLFSREAAAYSKNTGHGIGGMKMAVGCVSQVDAAASGVMFTSSPGDATSITVTASWGLGVSVVDGTVDPDVYEVLKADTDGPGFGIIHKKTGIKNSMTVPLAGGGTTCAATPAEKVNMPCLTDAQVRDLAAQAILIERHFRKPQDVEWAIDKDGAVYILQTRSLNIPESPARGQAAQVPEDTPVLMEGRGAAVYRGAGAGKVFVVTRDDEIDSVPRGSVLVSTTDSSKFVRVMPYLSAIITDTGTPASHMASVCREFRVPALVGAGDATKVLKEGQAVTLHIDEDGNAKVYDGIISSLVKASETDAFGMEGVGEYRKKRHILRYISPLHLIDPMMDNFTAEGCRTVHDVLRFIHEKSVAELIDEARRRSVKANDRTAVKLDLPIPAAIMVVDLGGGLNLAGGGGKAGIEQITSLPLSSILKGMTHPGVWHSEMVPLGARDFLTSMVRMPDIRTDAESFIANNLAVASREYMNLNLRFGYHFNMVDCYCSENARNNHVYFRFAGGATDIVKRSRRLDFIAGVLKEYGFGMNIKGDLLIARLSNQGQDRVLQVLEMLGRLISYTRQLDAMLHSDELVAKYVRDFLQGKYDFT
jgi:pyruvate,water dikinase